MPRTRKKAAAPVEPVEPQGTAQEPQGTTEGTAQGTVELVQRFVDVKEEARASVAVYLADMAEKHRLHRQTFRAAARALDNLR